ncbi:hypothetical protein THMIRHAS_02200 [Thiosulfatimonas sediminis]|uniref:DUF1461 domain-containing protein n=1 Tax=Thiosulfatimonas sediminis TaxID=2675054 RepID=A0A6F8PS37_9GAMM|nr:hypothetical protein THMIRHAS_02200 [Thiosulfatimonas sediminis]
MAKANFLYPVWHDYAGIGANIDEYAPKNRYRADFASTDANTRFTLFAGIVNAIHQQGHGLSALNYQSRYGTTPLLRNAEIVHLQDVAKLVDWLNRLILVVAGLWPMLTWQLHNALKKQAVQPAIKPQTAWLNLAIGLGVSLILLLLIGAKAVFYQLHIWIFPENHQWFFYYQDSLMSTMMKAPDLFAWIAASILILALGLFSLLLFFTNRFLCTGAPR